MSGIKTNEHTLSGVVIVAKGPALTKVIDAVAERDVRQATFFTTEMGRRYWERVQAKEPVDMPSLQADSRPEDRKAFTRLLSWGVEEAMECVVSIRGDDIPELSGDAAAVWLLRNRKDALTGLRDRLFTDEPGNGTEAEKGT